MKDLAWNRIAEITEANEKVMEKIMSYMTSCTGIPEGELIVRYEKELFRHFYLIIDKIINGRAWMQIFVLVKADAMLICFGCEYDGSICVNHHVKDHSAKPLPDKRLWRKVGITGGEGGVYYWDKVLVYSKSDVQRIYIPKNRPYQSDVVFSIVDGEKIPVRSKKDSL